MTTATKPGQKLEEIKALSSEDLKEFSDASLDFEGFYVMEHNGKPNPLKGILLGKQTLAGDGEDSSRVGYVVKLTHPCYVSVGRGDEARVQIASVGSLVFVGEKKKLESFAAFTPRRSANGQTMAFEVVFLPDRQIKLPGGKTMWTGKAKAKELSLSEIKLHGLGQMAQLGASQSRQLATSNVIDANDDIPFG